MGRHSKNGGNHTSPSGIFQNPSGEHLGEYHVHKTEAFKSTWVLCFPLLPSLCFKMDNGRICAETRHASPAALLHTLTFFWVRRSSYSAETTTGSELSLVNSLFFPTKNSAELTYVSHACVRPHNSGHQTLGTRATHTDFHHKF